MSAYGFDAATTSDTPMRTSIPARCPPSSSLRLAGPSPASPGRAASQPSVESTSSTMRATTGQDRAPSALGSIGRPAPSPSRPTTRRARREARSTSQRTARIARLRKARSSETCRRRHAREEIHRGDDHGDEQRDEQKLERPAADHPLADVDVGLRPLRELRRGVQAQHEVLRRAAELAEPRGRDRLDRVVVGRRRALAAGRDRDRRDPLRDERPLLVQREREREADELRDAPRNLGRLSGLVLDRGGRGREERRRGRARRVAAEEEHGWLGAGDRVEADHRDGERGAADPALEDLRMLGECLAPAPP